MNLVADGKTIEINTLDKGIVSFNIERIYLVEHSLGKGTAVPPSFIYIRNHGALKVGRREAMDVAEETGCAMA